MGAWGAHTFENDAAADWLADYSDRGPDAVIEALEDVMAIEDLSEIDVDQSCAALAAADIVATTLGFSREGESDDVFRIVLQHTVSLTMLEGIADLARKGMDRAVAPQTELYTLWHEDGADNGDWSGSIADLGARLEAAHLAAPGVWTLGEHATAAKVAYGSDESDMSAIRLDMLAIISRIDDLGDKIFQRFDDLANRISKLEKGIK